MKKFNIALAGCGSVSKKWIEYVLSRNDAEMVALVDINREHAIYVKNLYGLTCEVYGNIREAIEEAEANLVFNTTPPASHKDIVVTSLLMGCDVLGEKPMANSMAEAKDIIFAARKTGKKYAVMQNRRFNNYFRSLRETVISNAVGSVGFVCVDFFLGPHFGGYRDTMDNPLILDMSIHTFDQVRFLLSSDPVSVYCCEFNPKGSWYKGNAAAICIFEFPNNVIFC